MKNSETPSWLAIFVSIIGLIALLWVGVNEKFPSGIKGAMAAMRESGGSRRSKHCARFLNQFQILRILRMQKMILACQPGLLFRFRVMKREFRRYYPTAPVTKAVVGFAEKIL